MSDTFDPYRKWLGIPPAEQPPNHYRLLGVVLFEDDADTIENAADRQMSHVRNYQSGKYSDQSQKILNELSTAKRCLLNAARKNAYDLSLRTSASQNEQPLAPPVPAGSLTGERPLPTPPQISGAENPAASPPAPGAKPAPLATIKPATGNAPTAKVLPAAKILPTATVPTAGNAAPPASSAAAPAAKVTSAPRAADPQMAAPPVAAAPPQATTQSSGQDSVLAKRKGSGIPLLYIAAAGLGAVIMITGVLIAVNLAGRPKTAATDASVQPPTATNPQDAQDPQSPTTAPDAALTPEQKIAAMPPPERLDYYIAEAGKLTASRQYAQASKLLESQQKLAVEAAGVDKLNGKIAINEMANGLYYNLHNALRKFIKKKQPFEFEGDTFELVKKGRTKNTYKVNGQEYTFEPNKMPPHHVAAFAHKSLQGDNPQHLQFTSAFFAVDAASLKTKAGMESAKAYYHRAVAASGQHEPYLAGLLGVDVSQQQPAGPPMIVTLGNDETEPPEPVAAVTPAPPVIPSPAEGMAFFSSDAPAPFNRTPAPSAAQQQANRAGLQTRYRKTIARVVDAAGQLTFAGTLLNDAPSAGSTAMEYEMYQMAASIYSRLGAVAEYNSVLDIIEQKFEVDVTSSRTDLINRFVAIKTAPPLQLKEAYDSAVSLAKAAEKKHQYAKASQYALAALQIANKVKDLASVRAMKELRTSYAEGIKAEKDYLAALETLKSDPQDPAASQAAGRWLCYRLKQWEAGLVHLIHSPDPAEAAAAKADAAQPADLAQLAVTAELWNAYVAAQSSLAPAAQLTASQQWAVSERATYCLHLAFPALSREEQTAAAAAIEAFKALPKP